MRDRRDGPLGRFLDEAEHPHPATYTASDEIAQLDATRVLIEPDERNALAGLGGFEEAQERGVLAEQILDLDDAGARPVLDPGLGQVILDVVKAALGHWVMIDPEMEDGNGPSDPS